MAQAFDFVIDGRVFFDERVGLWNVRFWLVVVVVRHEVLDRVVWQKLAELVGQLRGQGFVGRHDERRSLDFFDQPRGGCRFTGTGSTQEHDVFFAVVEPARDLRNRSGLVTRRAVLADYLERGDAPLHVGTVPNRRNGNVGKSARLSAHSSSLTREGNRADRTRANGLCSRKRNRVHRDETHRGRNEGCDSRKYQRQRGCAFPRPQKI